MTDANVSLRQDLETIAVDDGQDRFRVIACDVSGTFTRVTLDAWKRLNRQQRGGNEDQALWALAAQAGWTRQRTGGTRRRWSPLVIQIPLVQIDRTAALLARGSDWLFGRRAMAAWTTVFTMAVVAVFSRWGRLRSDLADLPAFLVTCEPIKLALILATTKLLHELGHAVMCRRVGAKCGELGIMLFCGVPCPYCDVTQIWREPTSRSRMAVMFAGIHLEWILASFAVLVWCVAGEAVVRMYALNVMVLCGVSTLVFNANPLMRYDGYYVLADWLASPDLRHEARTAFRSGLERFLQHPLQTVTSIEMGRSLGLSVYHVVSVIYRIGVMIAIAGFAVRIGDWLGFRMAVRMLVIVAAVLMVFATRRSMFEMMAGHGHWNRIHWFRRGSFAGLIFLAVASLVLVPLPRFQSVRGTLDVAEATPVYLPRGSRLIDATIDFGDHVTEGQLLAITESTQTEINTIRSESRATLASMRTVLARHRMVSGLGDDRDWMTYETAERTAVAAAADAMRQRQDLQVVARRTGIVVPPPIANESSHQPPLTTPSLVHTVGGVREEGTAWCRIADPNHVAVTFVADSKLRGKVGPGDVIRVVIATQPHRRYAAIVESIAESDSESSTAWQSSLFEFRCRLRDPGDLNLLTHWGATCTAVLDLPRRSVAQDIIASLAWWIHE